MKRSLLVLILFYSFKFATACDPIFFSFCDSSMELEEDNIIVGKIIDEFDNGKQLEVLRKLRGQITTTNVTIWDGTDIWCNGPFSMSVAGYGSLGDTVICIMQQIDSIENNWDVIGDFRRPSSLSYLTYLNVVDGQLWNFDTLVSYSNFIIDWEAGACTNTVSASNIGTIDVLIFPNPANDYLRLSYHPTNWKNYSIFSSEGQLVSHLPFSTNTIPIHYLSSGLYFLRLKNTDGQESIHSFIKN